MSETEFIKFKATQEEHNKRVFDMLENFTKSMEKNNILVHKRIDSDNKKHAETIEAMEKHQIKPLKESVIKIYTVAWTIILIIIGTLIKVNWKLLS